MYELVFNILVLRVFVHVLSTLKTQKVSMQGWGSVWSLSQIFKQVQLIHCKSAYTCMKEIGMKITIITSGTFNIGLVRLKKQQAAVVET